MINVERLTRKFSIAEEADSQRGTALAALSLRQVRYFVTLAHTRSFKEAAQRLAVTQPALSIAIREMEKLIGAKLFDRSSHQLKMTEVGDAVLPLAEYLLNTAHVTFSDIVNIHTRHAQTVRIGIISSMSNRILMQLVALRSQHEHLRFEISDLTTQQLAVCVERGTVDFGIGVDGMTGEIQLESTYLLSDEMGVLVRKDSPLAIQKSVSWADVSQYPLAGFSQTDFTQLAGGSVRARRLRLTPTYRVEFTETLYSFVRSGLSLAVLPSLYAELVHDTNLVFVHVAKPRIKRNIVLLTSSKPPRTPAVSLCVEFLKRTLAQ